LLHQVTGTKEELVARLCGAPPPAKKQKVSAAVPGIDAALAPLLDDDKLKKAFQRLCKSLAHTVDRDWHDSYEETDAELYEYVEKLTPYLKAVLQCCQSKDAGAEAFARCNQVLVEIAESWRAFSGIPFRGGIEDAIAGAAVDLSLPDDEDEDNSMLSRSEAISEAWVALMQTAAARLPAAGAKTLQRIVKDALDYTLFEESDLLTAESRWQTEAGAARLSALLSEPSRTELLALPSRLRPIKHYQAIDRRFDGPKHLRTRDFSEFEQWFY
jgi:hypothetical protein